MSENNEEKTETEQERGDTELEEKVEKLESEVEEARAEAEEARDRMLRIAANYENYKKRLEKEKSNFVKYANEKIVKDLLPILDDFERAIVSNEGSSDFESFQEGVRMIYRQLNNVLEKYNVEKIEAEGEKFDPNLHEAIMRMPSNQPRNTVVQEYQKGYKYKDRVIRPSKVVVSAGSEEE